MPKWPACSLRKIVSAVFPAALQISSDHLFMSTMSKPLKHPQRLYFLSSVDSTSKTLLKESVRTEKTMSVNVTGDLFIFQELAKKTKNIIM